MAKVDSKNNVPLTSEKHLKDAIKKRNELNKQRSKAMERNIAAKLRGTRVPMSGAMRQYKGDVEIPFINHPGKYIIECKLSSQRNNTSGEPQLRLVFDWFTKLHSEAKSINAKFGVLIIHFQQFSNDYVFIRSDIVQMLIKRYGITMAETIRKLFSVAAVIDWRYDKKGKARSGYNVQRKELERDMITVNDIKGLRVFIPDGEYLVLHLDSFKEVVYDL